MHDEDRDLGSLFMKLPTKLRIDIFECVFNAGPDTSLLPSLLEFSPMQKATLSLSHIDWTIRNESQDTCTKLAKHNIEAPEAGIQAENVTVWKYAISA